MQLLNIIPSDKIKKLPTQIQYRFNTNNEIWLKLTDFLPELSTQIEHKI